jgi:2-methylcitrate dehydratase PrpD
MNFIEKLSHFCSSVKYEDFSPEIVGKAKKAIIDTHGVIFTGYKEQCSEILLDWVKNQGGKGQSTVLGYDFKTTPNFAALVNGTMGHATDFDDVFLPMRGHPSIPIYASVLAVSEAEQKTGKELIEAFLIGVEVVTRISSYMNPSHYLRGWHATCTIGVLGAAAAAGKLYGFNEEQFKTALGLSSSMISGLRLNFGTMTKPFHVGYAAKNGIEAAQLVKQGFEASHQIFDVEKGVFDLYTDEEIQPDWGDNLGKPFSIDHPGFNIKRYPCCYATHRAADAAHNLSKKLSLDFDDIDKIECVAPVATFTPLIHHRPKKGLEGKFSLEYVVAAMLMDQKLAPLTFTDEMVSRPAVQKLIPKVVAKEDPSIHEDRAKGDMGYVELIVYAKNRVYKERVAEAKGSANNPLNREELKEKYIDCHSLINKRETAKSTFAILEDLENVDSVQTFI